MKKRLAMLLAVLMLVSCLSPAWAVETPVATYDDAVDLMEDLGILDPAPDCGETDWEAQYQAGIRQRKADMGMPWPDGVNVTLNGEFLTLDGVEPIAVDNRTMVPVRAFLETLGAEVDYKGGVISVKLENGDSMEMKTDSTVLAHTVGDKIVKTDMGVTPYVRDGRIYIPARFAGEAMGLSVAWDSEYQVAHFTDWDKIAAELDEGFTAVNALLGAEGEKMDPEQTYAIDATASGAVTLYGETERENGTAKLESTAKGLLQGGKVDLTYGIKMDLGKLEEMLVPEQNEELATALELFSDFRVQLRGDMGEGQFYLKGNKLDQLPDSPVPANTWISMDMGQGIDVDAFYEGLNAGSGQQAYTVGNRLVVSYRLSDYAYGGTAPCANALAMANPVVFLLGDENFKVTTAGNTTTYVMKTDSAKLAERYKKLMGDTVNEYVLEYMTNMLSSMTVNFGFTARMRDNKIVDSKIDGNISLPAALTGSIPAELSFDLSSSSRHISGGYTLKGEYFGKMEMKMDLKVTDSTKTVPTAPAAGEKVVDMEELTGTNPGKGLSTAMETGLSLTAALLK